NDRLRAIAVKNGFPRPRILIDLVVRVLFKMKRLEPVCRINGSAPGMKLAGVGHARCRWNLAHIFPELFAVSPWPHGRCSPEHVTLSSDFVAAVADRGTTGIQPRPVTAATVT